MIGIQEKQITKAKITSIGRLEPASLNAKTFMTERNKMPNKVILILVKKTYSLTMKT